jgi:tetratricopeptide (TPR) repeat protein
VTPRQSPAASAGQTVGVTRIAIDYSRPQVKERTVWGGLVPYGQVWRAGANENTTISFSTPVKVEGRDLAAGSYGLHMIPTEDEWTIIFSTVDTNWGSFSYTEEDDALRVEVRPEPAPFAEVLTYGFAEPTETAVVVELLWEKLRVPFRVEVDTSAQVVAGFRRDLHGVQQFFWQPWNQAAAYLLQNEVELDQAMAWADRSISINENFANVNTKARILTRTGDEAAAKALIDRALPAANEQELNLYGYQLLGAQDLDGALAIFRRNVAEHPDSWNVHDSLGEGLAAAGHTAEAIASYEKALAMAPAAQKGRIEAILATLRAKG